MSSDLNLWQYLEQREEEIVRKRQELKEELEALRGARATLEMTQRGKRNADAEEKLTIKEMIRSVLWRNPEGGTSDQVAFWINQFHGVEVARTSLSPQLSRLKADGEVDLNEERGFWRLTEAGKRQEKERLAALSDDLPAFRNRARAFERNRR